MAVRRLASIADVKRALHRDANDTSIDDALASALEVAEEHVIRYVKQDFTRGGVQNTFTVYDRPEDSRVPVPVLGSTIAQVRFYRTPSATAYVGKPLIDYEVQHDGLQPPANLVVQQGASSGGSFTAGTYYWVTTAVNGAGETNGSNEYSAAIVSGGTATVAMQLYGGEQFVNIYRVAAQGTETTNPSCFVAQVPAQAGVPIPGQTGGPLTVAFTDTGTATTAGSAPLVNGTQTVPARWVRLHPTVFDVPFEGATSMHFPDNWSRVEIDYVAPPVIPAAIRDATALTAAALYVRGPITASAFTSESLGGYSYTQRPLRGQTTGSNEVIPEVAKALLRPLKRKRVFTT